ncbi:MAG: aminotransferase class V-fold PLP-dependent enzyme [Actinobacteria bacterium]|nr:aminotransferase class V-fold PLP-dependent enzyme [Actinomycetota bacterium]
MLEPVEHAGGLTVELEADGTVSPDRLAAVLDAGDQPVSVVSIMAINNETGVVNDIPALVPRPRLPLATPMSCASAPSEIASWRASAIGSVRS